MRSHGNMDITRALAAAIFVTVATCASTAAGASLTVDETYAGIQGQPVVGAEGDHAPGFATGSWQAGGNGWTQIYLDPMDLFGRAVTVGELQSISYWTRKDNAGTEVDWYLHIYTDPYAGSPGSAWYGNRINTEPYFAQNLDAPADQWNEWVTDADEDNRLRFYDSSTGYFGSYTDGFLQDLVNDPAYADQSILTFALAIGSGWADGFTGQVDGLTITLADSTTATVNMEVIPLPPAALAGLALLGAVGLGRVLRRHRSTVRADANG
ncbi:MAG: hypothetical protein WD009_08030 [Phycisphaeraceae bacterium]